MSEMTIAQRYDAADRAAFSNLSFGGENMSREERIEAQLRRRQISRELEVRFGRELAEEYLEEGVSAEAAEALFRHAWMEYHSNGYSEVESGYIDLAEIVNIAIRAERAS